MNGCMWVCRPRVPLCFGFHYQRVDKDIFFCSCARNVNTQVCEQVCVCVCVWKPYSTNPMCVSHYSGSPCIQRVQLQTSLGGVAKGLSRQRWSDQKIPGSLKYTTRALPLLTARLACREQTSPDKYTDRKKTKTFLRRVGAPHPLSSQPIC